MRNQRKNEIIIIFVWWKFLCFLYCRASYEIIILPQLYEYLEYKMFNCMGSSYENLHQRKFPALLYLHFIGDLIIIIL